MASAAAASSLVTNSNEDDILDLNQKFENWLKIKLGSVDDEVMFANYIVSIISDEESTEEDKIESIKPLLQELNQNETFDENKVCQEIVETWTRMKLEEQSNIECGKIKDKNQPTENPTDTILSMINKHKSHIDTKKHTTTNDRESCDYVADYVYDSDESEESVDEVGPNLSENTNAKDAKDKERVQREKLAEGHLKQKEQSKKALIDQKEKEIEKKKQKQAKAAKVERKR